MPNTNIRLYFNVKNSVENVDVLVNYVPNFKDSNQYKVESSLYAEFEGILSTLSYLELKLRLQSNIGDIAWSYLLKDFPNQQSLQINKTTPYGNLKLTLFHQTKLPTESVGQIDNAFLKI